MSVQLADAIVGAPGAAQRRAVAKAITLLESTRAVDRVRADELLGALLPHAGQSLRLGISGVPGVGKSTFIESFGLHLIGLGHRVAVLAIDPSSSVSGGSILGDKTRMERLSTAPQAFIRPSPSGGALGGVADATRESLIVCEAAGFDVVIVETVGVGQSETAVAGMTDLFVLLQLPNAGDDLQAIKRGVMELADFVVINKADIDAAAATRAQAQITSALRLTLLPRGSRGPRGAPESAAADVAQRVRLLSALSGDGIAALWQAIEAVAAQRRGDGQLQERRRHQALAWMWARIESGLRAAFRDDAAVRERLPALQAEVAAGHCVASAAARELLALHAGAGR